MLTARKLLFFFVDFFSQVHAAARADATAAAELVASAAEAAALEAAAAARADAAADAKRLSEWYAEQAAAMSQAANATAARLERASREKTALERDHAALRTEVGALLWHFGTLALWHPTSPLSLPRRRLRAGVGGPRGWTLARTRSIATLHYYLGLVLLIFWLIFRARTLFI